MAFSTQRTTSDGTLVLLDISIEYFDRSEIAVLFDGVVDVYPWEWVGTTEKKISFTPAVPNDVEVMLVRTTDLEAVRHIFTLGAQFTTQSLDEDLLQILHIAQEARENATIEEVFHNLNMHGYRIINIGDGIDPQDAPSMAQMVVHDAIIVAYRDAAQGYSLDALGYADDAAASAAAALTSEVNTGAAISVHEAGTAVHTIAGVSGLTAALSAKQDTLVSGTSLKTVGGVSLLGSGDVSIALADGDKGDVTVSAGGSTWTIDHKPTLGTPQATTSGTSKEFTGIPSWVTKITVTLFGLSTNGTSNLRLQIGPSGGVETSGYLSSAALGATFGLDSGGFSITASIAAASVSSGSIVLTLHDASTNTWTCAGSMGYSNSAGVSVCGGGKSLAGVLSRLKLTTVNGTDTFDAGSINILYE